MKTSTVSRTNERPSSYSRTGSAPRFSASSYSSRSNSSQDSSRGGSRNSYGSQNNFGGSRSGGHGPSRNLYGNGSQNGNRSGGRGSRRRFESTLDIEALINKVDRDAKDNASKLNKAVKPLIHATFAEFSLAPLINKNLSARGYTCPTPIQDQALPLAMAGRDVIGLASTGTGKTGAFLLPLLNKILANPSERVLIMAPTRELALQIEAELRIFAQNSGLSGTVCVGGLPIYRQISDLARNPNFVIGTPGRLKDLADRGRLNYSLYGNIVLDEVDRMLDMGFVDAISEIMRQVPEDRQTLFFSATMPPKIHTLAEKFLHDPVFVQIEAGHPAANVSQEVVRVKDKSQKFEILHKLLSEENSRRVLIFDETKRGVDRLTEDLTKRGYRVVSIHGDKRQRERSRALSEFSCGNADVLVATDVAARGIDIKEITHVINYSVPQTYDEYVHRIGRTGRGNNKGKAVTFV